mgnify:CR=1 FL=1
MLATAEKMVATDEKAYPAEQAALDRMASSLSPCQVRLPKAVIRGSLWADCCYGPGQAGPAANGPALLYTIPAFAGMAEKGRSAKVLLPIRESRLSSDRLDGYPSSVGIIGPALKVDIDVQPSHKPAWNRLEGSPLHAIAVRASPACSPCDDAPLSIFNFQNDADMIGPSPVAELEKIAGFGACRTP